VSGQHRRVTRDPGNRDGRIRSYYAATVYLSGQIGAQIAAQEPQPAITWPDSPKPHIWSQ